MPHPPPHDSRVDGPGYRAGPASVDEQIRRDPEDAPSSTSRPRCRRRPAPARARRPDLAPEGARYPLRGKGSTISTGAWVELVREPPSGTWEHRRADLFRLASDKLNQVQVSEDDGLERLLRRYLGAHAPRDEEARGQRQPSSGATYFRMLSMTCALYSTPNWFGTVSKSVSAAAIASSSASCGMSTSGSAA